MIHRRRRQVTHAALAPVLEFLESRQLLSAAVERVSLANNGDSATDQSGYGVVSSDGRYVAFESTATNLVAGDTNGVTDIYLRDTQSNTTRRISLAYDGAEPNAACLAPAISADGRYIVFTSNATNLVASDTNSQADVFLVDTQLNTIRLISIAYDGSQGDSGSDSASISGDGRYVTFLSNADNLVANDTNSASDVFVIDTQAANPADAISRISTTSGGVQALAASYNPVISSDGRFVAFLSDAENLITNDGNHVADVFVKDLSTGSTRRVSVANDGTEANGRSGRIAIAVTNDPTTHQATSYSVAYESFATNLVTGDTNNQQDIFLFKATNLTTGAYTTSRVSIAPGSNPNSNNLSEYPAISGDGRYVAYMSIATNLLANSADTNLVEDIFLYDTLTITTTRVSGGPLDPVTGTPSQANDESRYPFISSNGRYVGFFSNATNLLANNADQNGVGDIFVRDRLAAPAVSVAGSPDDTTYTDISSGDATPADADGTDFDLLDISDPATVHTFHITNTGSERLLLTGTNPVTLSGANAADFTILSQPGVTFLDPGESAAFTVRFDPSAPGVRKATVSIASNDANSPYFFDVKGIGTDATNTSRVVVTQGDNTTSPFSFGNVALNSAPKELVFTVLNVSDQTISLDSITLPADSPFEVKSSFGSLVLAPGETTTFSLRLNALTPGDVSATVHFSDLVGSDSKDVSFGVSGTIIVPHLSVQYNGNLLSQNQTQDIGVAYRVETAPNQVFTISNTGAADLVLELLSVSSGFLIGDNGSAISTDSANRSAVHVAPGSSVTFSIKLDSSTQGSKSGVLTLSSNDPDYPSFSINLTGTVTVPTAAVSVDGVAASSGASFNIGAGVYGQTGPTKTFTIANTGAAPLTISSVTTTTSNFTIVSQPSGSIAPGESATIVIRLQTSSIGAVSANALTFQTNEPNPDTSSSDPDHTIYTFTLTGNILPQPLTLLIDGVPATGQSISFGTLPQSTSAVTRTITLRNDGTSIINLLDTPSLTGSFTLASPLSTTFLSPGGSTSFTVSFTPIVSGDQSGIFSVPTDDSSHPTFSLGLTASVTASPKSSLGIDSVTLSKIPSTVIGGTKTATGTATVTLNNYSTAAISGSYKITLYASTGLYPVIGQDKVLGTQTVKVNLKAKAKSSAKVKLTIPNPPASAAYHIIAVVTGAKADPFYGFHAAPYTIRIEKPLASIGATPGSAVAIAGSLGKKVTQTVTFTNSGNQALTGTLSGELYLSTDGSITNATKITNLSGLKLGNIQPKKTQKVKITFTLPKTLPSGYAAPGSYTLLFKLTKIASTTPNSIPNDGLVPAGKITLK